MACTQQRLVIDSARTVWSGNSKNYCVWDFDVESWRETCSGNIFPWLLLPEQKEHYNAVAKDAGKTVWGPKVAIFKRTEESLSYVQCFLYVVSSSINVSIFHSTWLDVFWKDHIYVYIYAFVIINIYLMLPCICIYLCVCVSHCHQSDLSQ